MTKRDEIALKIGDVIKDNDPRMIGRQLTIMEIYPNGVGAKDSAGKFRVLLRHRIFTDSKTRRYGFNLISERNGP